MTVNIVKYNTFYHACSACCAGLTVYKGRLSNVYKGKLSNVYKGKLGDVQMATSRDILEDRSRDFRKQYKETLS